MSTALTTSTQYAQRSGRGQLVEAALYDSGISLLHPHAANWFMDGRVPGRTGNAHPNIYPYDTLRTVRDLTPLGGRALSAGLRVSF